MGYRGPLGMVTKEEFRKRTALRFSSRSGSTLKVDAAYDEYYDLRSEANRDKLHAALHQYLEEHGKAWDRCQRDKESGGLLKHLYGLTFAAPPMLNAVQRAQARVDDYDVPHSRFGVLYLLGNIEVDVEKIGFALESVGAIGGVVGAGLSLDTSKIKIADSSRVAFNVSGTPVTGQAVTSGGGAVLTIGKALAGTDAAGAVKNTAMGRQIDAARAVPLAQRTPEQRAMAQRHRNQAAIDHRVRQLPERDWFPNTISGLKAAGDAISETYNHNKALGVLAAVGIGIGGAIATPLVFAYDVLAKLWNQLKVAFYWIKDKIVAKIMTDGAWPYETLGTIAKAAAKFVLDMVFKNAAPFVSSLVDVGTGLAKTVEMAWQRASSYFDRKKIRITPGHPTEIANSIEWSMTQGMFLGLKDLLKGIGSTVLQSFLPGLGSVVNAALVAIEWLIKLIYRIAESLRIDKFLKVAKQKWGEEKARARTVTTDVATGKRVETVQLRDGTTRAPTKKVSLQFGDYRTHEVETGRSRLEPRIDGNGIISRLDEFTAFFKLGCDASPIIPMMVLNSGICGSLMTMIRLVDDTGTLIESGGKKKEFDVGNRYFQRLKEYSSRYLRGAGFVFRPTSAENVYIAGLLTHAVQHHESALTKGKALRAFLRG